MREKYDKQIQDLSGEWKHTLMTHCLTNLKEENEEKEKTPYQPLHSTKTRKVARLILI